MIIPSHLHLINISLSNNRLYGTIPISIQQRSQMQYLDLSFNYLSGAIDAMTQYSNIPRVEQQIILVMFAVCICKATDCLAISHRHL